MNESGGEQGSLEGSSSSSSLKLGAIRQWESCPGAVGATPVHVPHATGSWRAVSSSPNVHPPLRRCCSVID